METPFYLLILCIQQVIALSSGSLDVFQENVVMPSHTPPNTISITYHQPHASAFAISSAAWYNRFCSPGAFCV